MSRLNFVGFFVAFLIKSGFLVSVPQDKEWLQI